MEGVRKAGILIGARGDINLIEGTNTTLTIVDSSIQNNAINVTIASTGGGGGVGGTPALVLGTANTPGVAADFIRTDDTILVFDATAPTTWAFGDAASAGSGTTAAYRNHAHGAPANPVTAHNAASDPHTGYVLESLYDALGDIIYGSADNTPALLAGNTTATKKFLTQTGNGAVSAAPGWNVIVDGDVPATHSGSAHHNAITIGADGEHSLATQVLSGVAASTTQIGHVKVGADTPSTQAFGDAAAVGAGDGAANSLHKHAMPAAPKTVATDTLWDALGDLAYGTGADTAAKLVGQITTTIKYLQQTGSGAASAAPVWSTIAHSETTDQTATDHHAAPAAGPDAAITTDTGSAAGTASTFARSGHGHDITILTTKGDIFTYSTLPLRLAVGSNTQVLTADSTQATGIKWAAAAGGGDTATNLTATTTSADVSTSGLVLVTRTITGGTLAAGSTYRITAVGDVTLSASRTGTWRLRYNGTTLFDVSVTATQLTNDTTRAWIYDAIFTAQSTILARGGGSVVIALAATGASSAGMQAIWHGEGVSISSGSNAALDLFYLPDSNTGTNPVNCFEAIISKVA